MQAVKVIRKVGTWNLNTAVIPCTKHVVDFWTPAANSNWNGPTLQAVLSPGLNYQIKDEVTAKEEPGGLQSLVSLLFQMDHIV